MENLVIIKTSSTNWLCELLDNKDKTILLKAVDIKEYSIPKQIDAWICLNNLGELSTVKLSKTEGYSVKELNKKDKIYLKERCAEMEEIKKTAIHQLENDYFKDEK